MRSVFCSFLWLYVKTYCPHGQITAVAKSPDKLQTETESAAFLFPHQKFVLVFGLEHGGHLLQVETVPLLLQLWGEENGDDPLGDVGQVEVVVSLHHSVHNAVHTEASERGREEKGGRKKEKRERAGFGWDTERKVHVGQSVSVTTGCMWHLNIKVLFHTVC